MSFKPNTSGVDLANMALGMVGESKIITTFDDPGQIATACKRWYSPVVARLLELHHWGIATKRSPLDEVTNNRANEWLYAYAPPTDMAFPVGFTLGSGTSNVSYYQGLAGLIAMTYGKPIFQYHNGVIYSNVVGELEYVSYDITEADFPPAFSDIIIAMLASRLALELPKDKDLSDSFSEDAANKINIAMTQNLNAGGRTYGAVASEAELVRGCLYGTNWDYVPSSFGA